MLAAGYGPSPSEDVSKVAATSFIVLNLDVPGVELATVKLYADQDFRVGMIEEVCVPRVVHDLKLRHGAWKTRIEHTQPLPGFASTLRQRFDEVRETPCLNYSWIAFEAGNELSEFLGLNQTGVGQTVRSCKRIRTVEPPQ